MATYIPSSFWLKKPDNVVFSADRNHRKWKVHSDSPQCRDSVTMAEGVAS